MNNKTPFTIVNVFKLILIALWAVLCFAMTYRFIEGDFETTNTSGIAYLVYLYVFISGMFLVPGITVSQAQYAKANESVIEHSDKSYLTVLLLTVFLGVFGIHRFYVGKKISGFIYLLTLGGFFFGWAVDIVVLIKGLFVDKKKHLIVRPPKYSQNDSHSSGSSQKYIDRASALRKDDVNISSNYVEQASNINDDLEVSVGMSVPRVNFSDIEVPESVEKTDVNNTLSEALYEEGIKTNVESKESDDVSVSYTSLSDYQLKFQKDMEKYAEVEGNETQFVPFSEYMPTYDDMDKHQRAYYFYWRSQVRNEKYLTTDLSYVFVIVCEILCGHGWTKAIDGYNQLVSLWEVYRKQFPELDNYLFEWAFDFARINNLNVIVPEFDDVELPKYSAVRDLMVEQHSEETPINLSFNLICSLCDYRIKDSKFYKDNNQSLIQEMIPKVLTLVDAFLVKKHGIGILEIYGPVFPREQSYYMFDGAVCPYADQRVDVSVKPYSISLKLRNYITQIVRYSENVLREIFGYHGRLREAEIAPELSGLIKKFLRRECFAEAPIIDSDVKKNKLKEDIKLDFRNIEKIRAQSDYVRAALKVEDERDDKTEKTHIEELAEEPFDNKIWRMGSADVLENEANLQNIINEYVDSLTDVQKKAIKVILDNENSQEKLEELSEEAMTMPDLMIDEINEGATGYLDDIIIDTNDGIPYIFERYEDLLRNAVQVEVR